MEKTGRGGRSRQGGDWWSSAAALASLNTWERDGRGARGCMWWSNSWRKCESESLGAVGTRALFYLMTEEETSVGSQTPATVECLLSGKGYPKGLAGLGWCCCPTTSGWPWLLLWQGRRRSSSSLPATIFLCCSGNAPRRQYLVLNILKTALIMSGGCYNMPTRLLSQNPMF